MGNNLCKTNLARTITFTFRMLLHKDSAVQVSHRSHMCPDILHDIPGVRVHSRLDAVDSGVQQLLQPPGVWSTLLQ